MWREYLRTNTHAPGPGPVLVAVHAAREERGAPGHAHPDHGAHGAGRGQGVLSCTEPSSVTEVLGDEAMTVSFVTPALSYRVRSTSFWKGRSGLEKLLIVIVAALLILCCSCVIALMIAKQENYEFNFSSQWNQILMYGFSFQLHFNALYGSLGLHLMNLDESFLFIKLLGAVYKYPTFASRKALL